MKEKFDRNVFNYPAPGRFVDVGGANMHVFSVAPRAAAGTSAPLKEPPPLVFLSGHGTVCPVLDFKPLWVQMICCHIICVEKFGYGWSDITERPRDLDTVLADTRAALAGVDLAPPYVLVPHSLSGLESVLWAQKYPHEVAAIVGLDITVPAFERIVRLKLRHRIALKFSAMLTNMDMGDDAARYALRTRSPLRASYESEFLTDDDRAVFADVFRRRTLSPDMRREMAQIQAYIAKVREAPLPSDTPLLLFSSDFREARKQGQDAAAMLRHHREFAGQFNDAKHIGLDCGHYVHAHRPREIAAAMREFLTAAGV